MPLETVVIGFNAVQLWWVCEPVVFVVPDKAGIVWVWAPASAAVPDKAGIL